MLLLLASSLVVGAATPLGAPPLSANETVKFLLSLTREQPHALE